MTGLPYPFSLIQDWLEDTVENILNAPYRALRWFDKNYLQPSLSELKEKIITPVRSYLNTVKDELRNLINSITQSIKSTVWTSAYYTSVLINNVEDTIVNSINTTNRLVSSIPTYFDEAFNSFAQTFLDNLSPTLKGLFGFYFSGQMDPPGGGMLYYLQDTNKISRFSWEVGDKIREIVKKIEQHHKTRTVRVKKKNEREEFLDNITMAKNLMGAMAVDLDVTGALIEYLNPFSEIGGQEIINDVMRGMGIDDFISQYYNVYNDTHYFALARQYWGYGKGITVPDVGLIRDMFIKKKIDYNMADDWLKRTGYDGALVGNIIHSFYEIPDLSILFNLYWRNLISINSLKQYVEMLGYDEVMADRIIKLSEQIPGASDLVRFAVREAFTYWDELPPAPDDFRKYMKMQGYSEKWADAYWWSHWELPAPGQLLDAWHRGIITTDEFMTYLRWHDYAPFSRPGISKSDIEILTELMWDLPGKIDVRWMLEWGLIDRDTAIHLLTQIGVHPDWAPLVFTAWYNQILADYRNRVRERLKDLFRLYYIDEKSIRESMSELGYTNDAIELTIKEVKYEQQKDRIDDYLSLYRDLFIKDVIKEDELRAKMSSLGISPSGINYYIELFKEVKKYRTKH